MLQLCRDTDSTKSTFLRDVSWIVHWYKLSYSKDYSLHYRTHEIAPCQMDINHQLMAFFWQVSRYVTTNLSKFDGLHEKRNALVIYCIYDSFTVFSGPNHRRILLERRKKYLFNVAHKHIQWTPTHIIHRNRMDRPQNREKKLKRNKIHEE